MRKAVNWKIYLILLTVSIVSVILVFPYVLSLQGDLLRSTGFSIELLFITQLIQSSILFSLAIFLGLFFTKRINFKLPLLTAYLEHKNPGTILKKILSRSILLGILAAMAIYMLDLLFTVLGVQLSTHQSYAPIWQKLLASLYGGITEEILMRLFVMSFIIWLSMKLLKYTRPHAVSIWAAIFLAAIIFGLGHLPMTSALTEINGLVILRAVVLNGVGGVIFGWLFWKSGLESAMIAHFTADIFLLTILPFVLS